MMAARPLCLFTRKQPKSWLEAEQTLQICGPHWILLSDNALVEEFGVLPQK